MMHPLPKRLLQAIMDEEIIDWDKVYKEMERTFISERDRRRIAAIRLIYDIARYEVDKNG